jgi:diguanylate cyclase (GGDEF)-like protein
MIYRALLPIALPAGLLAACGLLALALMSHGDRLSQPQLRHTPGAIELQSQVETLLAGGSPGVALPTVLSDFERRATRCIDGLAPFAALTLRPTGVDGARRLCEEQAATLASIRRLAADAEAFDGGRASRILTAEVEVLVRRAHAFDDAIDGATRVAFAGLRAMLLAVYAMIAVTAVVATRRAITIIRHVERTTSALRESEERNRRLAHVDEVTQLPNRNHFSEHLSEMIAAAEAEGRRFSLLFIDLDGFKAVNDTLSHAAGDDLLRYVGLRLNELIRGSDMVARLGGDEFVVLANGIGSEEQTSAIAGRIVASVGRPYEIGGVECHVSASVGVTVYPDHGTTAATLLRNADLAMYEAKRLGKNGYVHFSARAEGRVRERVSIETALRRALPRGELSLVYQPVVSLATMRARSVESLLRWHHPVLGDVPPSKFIPVAEECGLIVEIGEWVISEAARQAAAWRASGAGDIQVAVNVAQQQIASDGFVGSVRGALADNALPPGTLVLEITESALMQRREQAINNLSSMAALGVELALDDFGTGYSSLGHLHTMPISAVKIDRSFLISDEDDHRAIVLNILGLARILNLRVVAEGVERQSAGLFLADAGCHFAQGYFFARPMPATAIDWQVDYCRLFPEDSDLRRLMQA